MKKLSIILLVLCLFSGCAPTTDVIIENTPDLLTPNTTAEGTDNSISVATPENTDTVIATPTIAPTSTPNATEVPFDKNNFKMLYVTGSDVNVRSKPSTSGELLFQFSLNQQVKAFYEKDGWYYVEYSENHYGYMSAKYLSETPSPIATPVPTMSRDMALNYDYRKIPMHLINEEAITTYEMIESENGRILVYEEKISQITQKIKDKDAEIGATVDSLVSKWINFVPNTTKTYMSLVEEFEPDQGTIFQVTRVSVLANEYKELLDYLENVYLMMVGFEIYVDPNITLAKESKEYYENQYEALKGNIERLNTETVRETLWNADGYATQSEKIIDWQDLWDSELNEFFDLKWQILKKLDFSKNAKSYDFYKAYDKYEIYNSYNNQFRDILRIMRGEKSFLDE